MTQTGATMGTLAFMAPEQKLSSRRATAISDLYSVGASLYLMLTNRNPSELYAHDIQERAFADLPTEVGDVLSKCCHLDPKERYQSASELVQALHSSDHALHHSLLLRKVQKDMQLKTLPDKTKSPVGTTHWASIPMT